MIEIITPENIKKEANLRITERLTLGLNYIQRLSVLGSIAVVTKEER